MQVDYERLATELGMSNVRSASNAWSAIKKKIMARAPMKEGDGEGAATPKPKATPRKRATPKKTDDEGDDDEGTPKKKPRSTKKKTAKSEDKVDDGEGEGDDEEGAKGSASPIKQEMEE
jgi:hypothetical protein